MFEKLRPDQDLQCYFERPSAIAALSATRPSGFTVSGSWRQQFDWAVIEWARDNVFEHPRFRALPDGNLSGLTLSYEETRTNCISVDSDLYPTVDWPYLRVWSDVSGIEHFYQVPLRRYAEVVEGSYIPASATMTLNGTPTDGDHVGFFCMGERYTHEVQGAATTEVILNDLVAQVNNHSAYLFAEQSGVQVRLWYVGQLPGGGRAAVSSSTTGSNGNRVGVYTHASGAQSEVWSSEWMTLTGGTSPTKWRIVIPFGSMRDRFDELVPTQNVRKLRWTYAAEIQAGAYVRSEFDATISSWSVTGTGRGNVVAGPTSRRIEDNSKGVVYTGSWTRGPGNFSGGTISTTTVSGSSVTLEYRCDAPHSLYLGTRVTFSGATARVVVNGGEAVVMSLFVAGEDVLVRRLVAELPAGAYTVRVEHLSNSYTTGDQYLYFDFLEIAVPVTTPTPTTIEPKITLATDWDTDHSLPLAPERSARMLDELGFRGRHNYYVGALWFYELYRKGHAYASKAITFIGSPLPGQIVSLTIVRDDYPPGTAAVINHLMWHGESGSSLARAFEQEINRGYTGIRAEVDGNVLTLYSRSMGEDGDHFTVTATPASGSFRVEVDGSASFSGGVNGVWTTDLSVVPRVNRACRDWSRSFFVALKGRGIDTSAAFSTELQHGDTSVEAAIVQRYPDQSPVKLNTPAIQTNFGPESKAYWRQVYFDMAQLMDEAGVQPYLQFGEVQWWYFPKRDDDNALIGMPFYDQYTTSQFEALHGRPMAVILSDTEDPSLYPEEAPFLATLIGQYTDHIMTFVRATYPNCRFEVLYPTDVNAGAMNQVVNYPLQAWTPAALDNLKTESFIFTLERRLQESRTKTINFGSSLGFTAEKRSHLVGISSPPTAWLKETRIAEVVTQDSVVLFALDQFCLIGYRLPLSHGSRRARRVA